MKRRSRRLGTALFTGIHLLKSAVQWKALIISSDVMRFPHPEQMKWNPKQNLPIAINTQKSSHTVQFHSVIHYFPFSTYSLDIAHNITACAWFAFQSTHTHTVTHSLVIQSLIHSVAFSPTHIVAPEKFRLPACLAFRMFHAYQIV